MTKRKPKLVDPENLGPGGRAYWDSTVRDYPALTDSQKLLLLDTCRLKDLGDQITAGMEKKSSLLEVVELPDGTAFEVRVDQAVAKFGSVTAQMGKHIAQMRLGLPPATGVGNPGGARGAYTPSQPGVSSLDRRRAQKSS